MRPGTVWRRRPLIDRVALGARRGGDSRPPRRVVVWLLPTRAWAIISHVAPKRRRLRYVVCAILVPVVFGTVLWHWFGRASWIRSIGFAVFVVALTHAITWWDRRRGKDATRRAAEARTDTR